MSAALLSATDVLVAAQSSNEADVQVFLWPDEDEVATGELLCADVQVRNDGEATATNVLVTLPKNDRHYIYTTTNFSRAFDETTDTDVTIKFERIVGNGGEEVGVVCMRVQRNPPASVFFLSATYGWNDPSGGETDQHSQRAGIFIEDSGDRRPRSSRSGPDTAPPEIHDIAIARFGIDGYEITWSATDTSGIAYYDVDYKIIPRGGWTPFRREIREPRAVLAPASGNHFTFRIRAFDIYLNESHWIEVPIDTRSAQ